MASAGPYAWWRKVAFWTDSSEKKIRTFLRNQDSERHHVEAGKSQYLGYGFTERHKIWYDEANWHSSPCQPLKFWLKNPTCRTAAVLKTEKSRYLGDALTDRHEIRQGGAEALNHPCAAAMRPFVKLLWPLVTCIDVDECALGGQVCTQTARCDNTYGSYRCVCKEGFEQDSDSQTCRGNSSV